MDVFNFVRVRWRREFKLRCLDPVRIPVAQPQRVLWRPGHPFGRDDVFNRQWLAALADPDLPVDDIGPEGEMIAFDAVDEGRSDNGSLRDAISEDGVGVACEQVRPRSIKFACGAKLLCRIFNAAAGTL